MNTTINFDFIKELTELMEAELNEKRMEHIQTLKDTFTSQDADGNEESYFCDKFLIIKYLKMSDADLELNEKFKIEQAAAKQRAEEEIDSENSEAEDIDSSEGEEETPTDDSDNEIDQEMMGDVQPEESEETVES